MSFVGVNRQQNVTFYVRDQNLTLRPYNERLSQLTGKICGEIGLGDSDVCLFETRVAFDCLLRKKVQKWGAVTDNVGTCSEHINAMKANIEKAQPSRVDFASVLDGHLEDLHYL
jgi:hypothetical protein